MSRSVAMLLDLRERVERLENQRADDGYWTTIKSVDAATASITTAEGRKVPIWSMSSRLVIQPVAGDQCLVLRGLAVCGVRPYGAGESDGDVDMIRDVLRHDRSNGEIGIGASPTDFVALAGLVLGALNTLKSVFSSWAPVAQDGGAALKALFTSDLADWPPEVKAEKVKAQ